MAVSNTGRNNAKFAIITITGLTPENTPFQHEMQHQSIKDIFFFIIFALTLTSILNRLNRRLITVFLDKILSIYSRKPRLITFITPLTSFQPFACTNSITTLRFPIHMQQIWGQ